MSLKSVQKAERERQRRFLRRQAGLCYICGKQKVVTGRKSCGTCADAANRRYSNNPSLYRAKANRVTKKLRKRILDHYGNRCVCCGESTFEFLAVDHINNDGAEHRKQVGSGAAFSRWLVKNNFPPGFQLLCHNCNSAKEFYGVCPHKRLALAA